jgi:hypothetical protein
LQKYITNAKNLAKEIFGVTAVPNDEDGLMDRFQKMCEVELSQRDADTNDYGIYFLLEEYKKNNYYPGKKVLESGVSLFEDIIKIKDTREFYEKLDEIQDNFIKYEEEVYDVKKFFKNQKEQFDKACLILKQYENNKTYITDESVKIVTEEIKGIIELDKPYSQIHKLPDLINNLRTNSYNVLRKNVSR